MHTFHYFFFSYSSTNHANAAWEFKGKNGNHLDEFFRALCREVSDKTLERRTAETVAFRDRPRIKLAERWGDEVIEGLQRARVFIALLSPHYFESNHCMKEFVFFRNRLLASLKQADNDTKSKPPQHIIPLFWEDAEICDKAIPTEVGKVLDGFNFTQEGMPENYPAVGLAQICKLRSGSDYELICNSIAKRIVELAESQCEIPELPGEGNYDELGYNLVEAKEDVDEELVLDGPSGANVIYLVSTKAEVEAVGGGAADSYEEEREEWRPFPHLPGASVELLTTEGVKAAGVKRVRNLGLPEDVNSVIDKAEERNSPVLLVFDRGSLTLPKIKPQLTQYAAHGHKYCGLVTAGGGHVTEDEIKGVFGVKHIPQYPNHIWNVPATREEYVSSVTQVVIGLKRQLMQEGIPVTCPAAGVPPGLSGPAGE